MSIRRSGQSIWNPWQPGIRLTDEPGCRRHYPLASGVRPPGALNLVGSIVTGLRRRCFIESCKRTGAPSWPSWRTGAKGRTSPFHHRRDRGVPALRELGPRLSSSPLRSGPPVAFGQGRQGDPRRLCERARATVRIRTIWSLRGTSLPPSTRRRGQLRQRWREGTVDLDSGEDRARWSAQNVAAIVRVLPTRGYTGVRIRMEAARRQRADISPAATGLASASTVSICATVNPSSRITGCSAAGTIGGVTPGRM